MEGSRGAAQAATRRLAGGYRRRLQWAPAGTWSRDRIGAALRDWHREFGESPRTYEWSPSSARAAGLENDRTRRWQTEHPRWPSLTTVVKYFGSWPDALAEAGLPPRVARREWELSLPDRVAEAQRMRARGLTLAEIGALLDVHARTVAAYLNAGRCPDCGGPVIRGARCPECAHAQVQPSWTREAVLEALEDWMREHGEPPRREDWAPSEDRSRRWTREYPRWPSYMVARNLFGGSWNAVLEAAGHPLRRRASWSRDEAIEALRGFAREHGRTPTQDDVNSAGSTLPSWDKVTELFGSFASGLEAAGMTPNRRRWTREQITEAIRAFAEAHGRPPRAADWQRATMENPHTWTVAHAFGSWPDALRAAGLVPPKLIWDRDRIAEAIRTFTAEHRRPPRTTDWRRRDPEGRWPNVETVARHFGSWRAGLAAAEAQDGS